MEAVAVFYNGKTFTVYIGGSADGGYDFYGRALARFLGKNIPGKPDVLAVNKPGAGTLLLANWRHTVGRLRHGPFRPRPDRRIFPEAARFRQSPPVTEAVKSP